MSNMKDLGTRWMIEKPHKSRVCFWYIRNHKINHPLLLSFIIEKSVSWYIRKHKINHPLLLSFFIEKSVSRLLDLPTSSIYRTLEPSKWCRQLYWNLPWKIYCFQYSASGSTKTNISQQLGHSENSITLLLYLLSNQNFHVFVFDIHWKWDNLYEKTFENWKILQQIGAIHKNHSVWALPCNFRYFLIHRKDRNRIIVKVSN